MVAGAGVGAAAVLLTGGHPSASGNQGTGGFVAPSATPSAPASAAPSPSATGPLTMTQAKGVLAAYTTANNGANAQRSDTMLASVEIGIQLRDRRGPVPGAAGGGHGAVPGVRRGPGDVLHPAR